MFKVLAVVLNIVGGVPSGELFHLHGVANFATIEACYRYVNENEASLRGAAKAEVDTRDDVPDGTIYRIVLTCNDGGEPTGNETNAPKDVPAPKSDWINIFHDIMEDMRSGGGFGAMKD